MPVAKACASTFASTTDAQWREELELKFFSQILPVRAFRPMLDKSDAPAIVGVNSLLSLQPEPHMVCTSAARAGVQNLLKSLAAEFAPRIRVNSIMLGLIDPAASGQRRFEARPGQARSRAEQWPTAHWAHEQAHLHSGRLGTPDEAARAPSWSSARQPQATSRAPVSKFRAAYRVATFKDRAV